MPEAPRTPEAEADPAESDPGSSPLADEADDVASGHGLASRPPEGFEPI